MSIESARPITLGTPVTGSINRDRQYYSLTLTEAQTVSIFLDGGTLSDAYLRLLDFNGRFIQANDDGGGNRDSLIT